jgi:hypothetical protein
LPYQRQELLCRTPDEVDSQWDSFSGCFADSFAGCISACTAGRVSVCFGGCTTTGLLRPLSSLLPARGHIATKIAKANAAKA